MHSLLLVWLGLTATCTIAAQATPQASIAAGTLNGGQCNGSSDAVFFKGVPYGKSPTGDLRFAPPQLYNETYPGGSRNASSSGPSCIQFGDLYTESGSTSEDCLLLDIWAPASATNTSALPVKVWVYGGADSSGGISNILYDGCQLGKDDALMVSIAYRLGPLGFLGLASAGFQGNQAIQDILMGLEWIQSNIASFGGDPNKVVLFGESAGASNVFVVATLSQAPSLINAAVTESGGGRDIELNSTMQTLGKSYSEHLGCSSTNATCFRSKSVSELQKAYTKVPSIHTGLGYDGDLSIATAETPQFAPYVDGEIIPTQPSEEGVRVPSIIGTNSKEGTWFTLDEFGNDPGSVTADNYTKFLKDNFGSAASSIEKVYSFSAYENEEYPGWSAIVDTITDASFRCSAYRALNRAVEKNIPVWTYLFTHTPSCTWLSGINDDELSVLGATHTAELPYSFGMMDNSVLTGGSCNSTDAEYAISNFMIQAWTSMAAIGRPSSDNASWPEYNNASSPSIIFTNSTGLGAINYTTCAVWDPVDQDFLPSSTTTSASSTSTVKPSSATSSKGASTRITVAVEGWFITGLIIGLTPFL